MAHDNNAAVLDVDDDDVHSEVGSEGQNLTHRLIFQSVASLSTSLCNSLLDCRLENGRTYHRYKDGSM
ncbi:uncharacterized protein CLUP02_05642 [Colletotrichum lupini]|uniref:Uncharacterized protein n=1 Tax=Colletotrichum lupini TaxID=145971 RepID=A0A9Q8SMY7_9PEZI|nr:uncharacterized protein CLUP02_05642 [Colletotrichum lupini]UQC80160.1 hypothetical protein CLUP02_05642 [Colletotrichum lupini]